MIDNLIGKYRRGKYLESIVAQAMKEFTQSKNSMTQAVAFKYANFLSRRKFSLMCKTQSYVFDADKDIWIPRNIKCMGIDMQLSLSYISNESVGKFVKSLDIGCISQIPNVPGVTRTITGLVFMIIDLHLRLPHLCRRLVWFNGNTNHFVFQFSDDGAPETSQLSMSVGSMTLWNLGDRVRSREFQYLLHLVSLGEKHEVLELLWQQHSEEMLLLESSVFTVFGRECTLEFQPSADMSWQSWACNEVNQAATYPCIYANVHKGDMHTMGGSIGSSGCLWKPYTSDVRDKHLSMVNKYVDTLPKGLSKKATHAKTLAFMADNGIRQLGKPRVGVFADRMRPDPLHCGINAWQHILDLIYSESLRRGLFRTFIQTLSAPVGVNSVDVNGSAVTADSTTLSADCVASETDGLHVHVCGVNRSVDSVVAINTTESEDCSSSHAIGTGIIGQLPLLELSKKTAVDNMNNRLSTSLVASCGTTSTDYGCGLAFLKTKIEEHHKDEAKRFNKLSIRLVGAQAIQLARHSYRLVDCLKTTNETEAEKLKRSALSKIVEYLRNAGGLFNKIFVNTPSEIDQLNEFCQLYFNLLAIFFPESINVTVWTVGYALPYHARKLYEDYGIGFGILSLQAKESKHSGLKAELALTNRSCKSESNGKWWQVMRANYIRSFYLPEHQPSPPTYTSHFKSRKPPHCDFPSHCDCGRKKDVAEFVQCDVCRECMCVVRCAQQQELSQDVVVILKPITCNECDKRFSDKAGLEVHSKAVHTVSQSGIFTGSQTSLKSLPVVQLKNLLRAKGLSTSGNKGVLITCLEGVLSGDL